MRVEVDHIVPADPNTVLPYVDDLVRYPEWSSLLYRVEEDISSVGEGKSWNVELRGRLGPFARSKRLRMVSVPTQTPGHVRFERRERDAEQHGRWNLDVKLDGGGDPHSTHVVMVLEYEGRLWSGAIEKLLREEIASSKRRLEALVSPRS